MNILELTRSIRCHELREGVACGGFYEENGICTRCGIAKHEPYDKGPTEVTYWRGTRTKDDVRREVLREVTLVIQTMSNLPASCLTDSGPYLSKFDSAMIDMIVEARWENEKDLSDLSYITDQVSRVYDHITCGLLSKPNYEAGVVIAAADDCNTKWTDTVVEDEKTIMQDEIDTLEEKYSQLHKLASDLCYQDEFGHSGGYFKVVKRLHNFLADEPNPLPLWRRAGRKLSAIFAALRRKGLATSGF